MAGRLNRDKGLPTSFAYKDPTVNAAIGGSSPGGVSGVNQMVLAGKGGYTKLGNGELIKGTYLGANTTPYQNNVLGNSTPFAYNGQRIGKIGPDGFQPKGMPANPGQPTALFGTAAPAGRHPFQNDGRMPLNPGASGPHTQIGQKGKGAGSTKPTSQQPNLGGVGGYPALPGQIPNFLPNTPQFEAAQRGANDQLTAAEGQYAAGQQMIPAEANLQRARLNTDQAYATEAEKEMLAQRGIFATGSGPAGTGGVSSYLMGRDVSTPFGRQFQDLGANVAGQYGNLASQYGGAQLGFNQDIMNALLQRASDAYGQMPMSIPFDYQTPHMQQPMFSNKPAGRTRRRHHGGK